MASRSLIANASFVVLVSFLASKLRDADNPWPICYLSFPVMEVAGISGFLIVPVIFLMFIAVLVLGVRAAISPTSERRKAALIVAHGFIAMVFLVPAVFEAFGQYVGP